MPLLVIGYFAQFAGKASHQPNNLGAGAGQPAPVNAMLFFTKTLLWFVLVTTTTGTGYTIIAMLAAVARGHGDTALAFTFAIGVVGCFAWLAGVVLWHMPTAKHFAHLQRIKQRGQRRDAVTKQAQARGRKSHG